METISPIYARLVLREIERREIDPAPIFAGTALSRHELLRGGDIAVGDFLRILHAGDRLLADERLGLMLGRKLHVFAMGPVGAGMAVAPSLRDGLQLLESYTRLHASYIDVNARSTTRGLTVTVLYAHETGHAESFHSETALMLLQQYMETVAGEPIYDADYRLAIPEPGDRRDYKDALHGRIRFDADESEVDIPQRWLDLPSPYYDAELWEQARIDLARSLKRQGGSDGAPFTQHVAAVLRTSNPPLPELRDVAFDLHISARTLNRRLKAEDASFRQLRTSALISRARQYLRDTDYTVERIAEELGYQDAANFRRAFRKSSGCSPIEFRKNVGAA